MRIVPHHRFTGSECQQAARPPVSVHDLEDWPAPTVIASRSHNDCEMPPDHIKEAIERTTDQLKDHPEAGRGTNAPATATLEDGLRVRIEGPNDFEIVTDMPESVGGEESGPTPGWLSRAALASCDATVVAMRAAQEGIKLTTLEVMVKSDSDSRGFLGIDDSVPPGPLTLRTTVRLSADGVPSERLKAVVDWADEHSPVGDAFCRTIENEIDVEIV